MRNTLFSMVCLAFYGCVAGFLMVFVLNLAGLPGALLAGMPGKRSKQRFVLGSLVSAIGQSYLSLAFVSFIVSWTHLAARRDDVVGFLVWPVAFLAVLLPTFTCLIRARIESLEHKHASAQVEGLHLTFLLAVAAFPLFAFVPGVMTAWRWVPIVSGLVGAE